MNYIYRKVYRSCWSIHFTEQRIHGACAALLAIAVLFGSLNPVQAQCLSSGNDQRSPLNGTTYPQNSYTFSNLCPAAGPVHVFLKVTADLGCHALDATNCGTVPSCPGSDCICTTPACHCNTAPTSKYITLKIGPPGGEVSINSGNTDPDPATQPYALSPRPWLDVPADGRFFKEWAGNNGREKEYGMSWCSGMTQYGDSTNEHRFYIPASTWNQWLGSGNSIRFIVTITSVSLELTTYCSTSLGTGCGKSSIGSFSRITFSYTPSGRCCHSDGTCAETSQANCSASGDVWMAGASCGAGACPIGSCCYGDSCLVTTQGGCTSGTWTQGDSCSCAGVRGDLNSDALVDGLDIPGFVDCVIAPSACGACVCADLLDDDQVNLLDVPCFVQKLLTGTSSCEGGYGPRGIHDCNYNDIADDIDIANETSADCNHNFIPDECDIAAETSNDLNENGIPDECEPDCNENGVPDDKDIADETSDDVNGNGIPDECEADCNENGVPDDWDVAQETSPDCNANGIPDECELDCNHNDVPDDCDTDPNDPDGDEIVWEDCNGNGRPDECDFNWPPPLGSLDCNENGIPDECDIADCPENEPSCQDCNENGFPDGCDIAAEISLDENENGIPDECEGEGMMGGGGMIQQESMFFGDPEERRAAWAEYYDWLTRQRWGMNSDVSGTEQFRAMVDKLRELGLPVRDPRVR